MICTNIGLHHVNSLRLLRASRDNGFSLTMVLQRGDVTSGISEETLDLVIYVQTEAEFDFLLSTLPRADNFSEWTPANKSVAA